MKYEPGGLFCQLPECVTSNIGEVYVLVGLLAKVVIFIWGILRWGSQLGREVECWILGRLSARGVRDWSVKPTAAAEVP